MKRWLTGVLLVLLCSSLFAINKGENGILAFELSPQNSSLDLWAASVESFVPGLPLPGLTAKVRSQWTTDLNRDTGLAMFDLEAKGRYLWGALIPGELPDDWAFLKGGGLTGPFLGVGITFHRWTTETGASLTTGGLMTELGSKVFFDRHWYFEGSLRAEVVLPVGWHQPKDRLPYWRSVPVLASGSAFGYVY